MSKAVTIEDIRAAADRLRPYITRTPLLQSTALDGRAQGEVFLKAECLQRTGSFKLRGALNRLLQLSDAQRDRGVVAYSSGNHAQGVALAAQIVGCPATIVMPEDAPDTKKDRTRRYGAEVVTYDRYSESREEIGARLADEKNAVLVPPYDDPDIIAGQGTVGLEIAEEAALRGIELDQVLVCCSGGGLASGISLALAAEHRSARVLTVEPKGFDDMRRSLSTGARVSNDPGHKSICDALLQPLPGELTFPILKAAGAAGLAVDDAEAMDAIRFAAEEMKVVLEPGGAVALAAILSGYADTRDKRTVAILSGGNVDGARFRDALDGAR